MTIGEVSEKVSALLRDENFVLLKSEHDKKTFLKF